ncbi:MAG: CSLREA domain-containing protein [Candidatus Kerfeldbacteria bacterium]
MERLRFIKALAIAGSASVFIFACTAVPASATNYVVTKTADTNDGTCNSDCSLREAIRAANDVLGDDEVTIPAGTYTFTLAGRGEDAASTGDLDIEDNLIIRGDKASNTIIDADDLDRVFEVEAGWIVELHDLTIQNGTAAVGSGANGGGIANEGVLSIYDCIIKNNIASSFSGVTGGSGNGGGIYNNGAMPLIERTTFDGNKAVMSRSSNFGTGMGGAIYNNLEITTINDSEFTGNYGSYNTGTGNFAGYAGAIHNDSTLGTLKHSTLSNNGAVYTEGLGTGYGGGIFNNGTWTTLRNTTFKANVALEHEGPGFAAGYGGAAFNNNSLQTIQRVKILNNTAKKGTGQGYGYAGGVFINAPIATMEHMTIDGNVALSYNSVSGSSLGYGGGLYVNSVVTTFRNTTISNNTAKKGFNDGNGYGGGMYVNSKISHFQNSTVSGNTTCEYTGSGTVGCWGGGIYENADGSSYDHVTIADNTTANVTGSGMANASAGGIFQGGTALALKNSILSGNYEDGDQTTASDCEIWGTLTSGGYNIFSETTDCTVTTSTGDQTNTDPEIGILNDNGGFNETHKLLDGSPALDKIPTAVCTLNEDQREVERPQGENNKCDVGAYELEQWGAVAELVPQQNTELKVKYTYGSDQTFDVFTTGTAKPKCKLAKDGERIVCVKYNGKNVSVTDSWSGEVLSKTKIRKNKQPYVKLKVFDFYDDDPKNEVVVASIRNNKLRTTIITLTDEKSKLKNENTKKEDPFTRDGFDIDGHKKRVQIMYGSDVLHEYKVNSDRDLEDWSS